MSDGNEKVPPPTDAAGDAVAIPTPADPPPDTGSTPKFGDQVSTGVKRVFASILKENVKVPLFIGQTMAESMRDVGYLDTTTAICEHVDNALAANASEIRIYFRERRERRERRGRGRPPAGKIDILIYDNGRGMEPLVLRAASAFGGSMGFGNRTSLGRFGVGMKAAALSQGPTLDIYSWQEPTAVYNVCLDLKEISRQNANVVYVPDPEFSRSLPYEIQEILTDQMTYPNRELSPDLEPLAENPDDLEAALGRSGTIVFIPECDRLSKSSTKGLVDDAVKAMSRIYRNFLAQGKNIYINNRPLTFFDPTYRSRSAWHVHALEAYARETGLEIAEMVSRAVMDDEEVPIAVAADSDRTHPVRIRLVMLPESWYDLGRTVLKNIRVFTDEDKGVSILRNGREIQIGPFYKLVKSLTTRDVWWRLEIDFPGGLDEAFGVFVNKQGIRPQEHVILALHKAINQQLVRVRNRIREIQARRSSSDNAPKASDPERKATEAEAFQATVLPKPLLKGEELEQHLKTMAFHHRRGEETEQQALDRIRSSTYLTTFKHDPDAPFYRVDFDADAAKVVLTLNSAHPFYDLVYRPLMDLEVQCRRVQVDADDHDADPDLGQLAKRALEGLQLTLFSLARTQAALTENDQDSDAPTSRLFDRLRKQWSMNLETQLGQQ
jgi:hypothetical protein